MVCFNLGSHVCVCVLGSEDQARLYTAEIVSAVSHLHKCGIVHRDLKPENILMDTDGHVMAGIMDSVHREDFMKINWLISINFLNKWRVNVKSSKQPLSCRLC